MEIPNNFTMEFFESEVLTLVRSMQIEHSARIRFTVFRNDGGLYLPYTRDVSYLIQAFPLEQTTYIFSENKYEVDLYKDCYVAKQLLSTLKTTNKMLHVMGSIYAQENGLHNCLLLNTDKNVVEALNGNIFLKANNKLITPPLSEGCLNGIMRKQVLQLATKIENLEILEEPISPFDLQKADELFITNIISGIVSISKYRKKEFDTKTAVTITRLLNENLN
jgi:branched-chain amino acid aminotransferase